MEGITAMSSRSLQYHVIASKWLSDLEFYKFEMGFLRTLLDNHFFNIRYKEDRANVIGLNNDLMKLEVDKNQLELALDDQIRQLELMSEDIVPEDVTSLAAKQIKLEYMVTHIFSEYKELKKQIFSLVQKAYQKPGIAIERIIPN
jgi:hypothetical protein